MRQWLRLAPLWRAVLALALLASVQGALLHPLSHLHAHAHESGEALSRLATDAGAHDVVHAGSHESGRHAGHDDHGTPAHHSVQCDVCVALGALAGYADAPAPGPAPSAAGAVALASAVTAFHLPSPRAPFSPRAPPLC